MFFVPLQRKSSSDAGLLSKARRHQADDLVAAHYAALLAGRSRSYRAASAAGSVMSCRCSGVTMLSSIGADRDRVRILSTTSALLTPWANASAPADSSASRPSTFAAVRILTISPRTSRANLQDLPLPVEAVAPSSLPFNLTCRRFSADGSASCLNGAPFLSAPGFFARTGT